MATNIKIQLDHEGIKALLNSPDMQAALNSEANRIVQAANSYAGQAAYKAKPLGEGYSRAVALVIPTDGAGARLEQTEHALSRGLSSCRS